MPLPIAGLLLSALGTGVGILNQKKAADRQRRASAAAGERQRARQRETAAVIDEQVQKLRAPKRIGELDIAEEEIGQDLQNTLRKSGASEDAVAISNRGGTGGRISDAAQGRITGGIAKRAQSRADLSRLLSRIEAPSALARAEGKDFSNLAIANQLQRNFAQGDAFVDQGRVQRAGQPNALLGFLGGAAQGVGGSLISSPGAGSGGLAGLFGGGRTGNFAPVTNRDVPAGNF